MAVYTIRIGSIDRLFNADDIEDAKKIAKSKGWNPENIIAGDWIRYPDTGYPRLGTPEREAYKEPVIDIDYSRASIPGELPPPTGKERFGAAEPVQEPTAEPVDPWQEAFEKYQEFVKANPNLNLPVYKDANDYRLHEAEWLENLPYYQAGFSQDQIDSYPRFGAFGNKYGNLNDKYPKNLLDYLENYDEFQQQLNIWIQEAGPEATGFTDDEVRQFLDYKQWYYQYGKPGDPVPVDVGDFLTNQAEYQNQLKIWQQQAAEVEEYEVDPAEAARRRDEAYMRQQYIPKSPFREIRNINNPFNRGCKSKQDSLGRYRNIQKGNFLV